MRDIKFRAWWEFEDGYKMIGMEELWELDGEEFCIFTILTTPEERQDGEETVFMQYTGLKDKNGKEIYEGDIIKINYKDIALPIENGIVSFVENGYFIDTGDSIIGLFDEIQIKEVLGNIYENKELVRKRSQ